MAYIGKSTDGLGVRNRFLFVADASDTSVSGADANGATLTFTDCAYVDVYLNGVLLKAGTDYNTNTANTIAGLSALSANDEVTVLVYDIFSVADTVSAASGGTFSGAVTLSGGVSSSLTVANNLTLTNGDIVFGTADKGICLGATSATAANTLHDYEEGTYAITLTFDGSGSATSSGTRGTGNYTKIGALVTCGADFRITGASSPNGQSNLTLPFTVLSTSHRLFTGVILTVGIAEQTSQTYGGFFLKTTTNAAKAGIFYQTTSTHLGLQGENAGLSNGDAFVHSITYLTEQ